MSESVATRREQEYRSARAVLEAATSIVLTTHVQPDGDGIGSEVALAHHLWSLGKDVTILNPHVTPRRFRFLDPDPAIVAYDFETADTLLSNADLLVVLDISVPERLGKLEPHVVEHDPRTLVIDHHAGRSLIEGEELRFSDAAATGEIVFRLLADWPVRWTREIATALYAAIAYDTGGFRFSNTTEMTHRIAAELMVLGADTRLANEHLFESFSLGRTHLVARLLGNFERSAHGRVATAVLPLEWMAEAGAKNEDVDGIVEMLRAIEGVEVAILIKEVGVGATKVSFRSVGRHDVSDFAGRFGGGGHVHASGAFIREPLADVVAKVVPAARETFDPV